MPTQTENSRPAQSLLLHPPDPSRPMFCIWWTAKDISAVGCTAGKLSKLPTISDASQELESLRLIHTLGADFMGGLTSRIRAIAHEQRTTARLHLNTGIVYLRATTTLFSLAHDYETPSPLVPHADILDKQSLPKKRASLSTRPSAYGDRTKLEGIGAVIGMGTAHIVPEDDDQGKKTFRKVSMWEAAGEILEPSFEAMMNAKEEWKMQGVPVRDMDNWAFEALVMAWVHLCKHVEVATVANDIAAVGRARWGARWDYRAVHIAREEARFQKSLQRTFTPAA